MNRYTSFIKPGLLLIVFTMLFLPLAQTNLHLFLVKDLKGFFVSVEDIDLSGQNWMSLEFQEKKEKYINENFGFRNTLVRLMNQIKFGFFLKTSNSETIIGKNNVMYAKAYLEAYTGENYVGNNVVMKKCYLVKKLQDKLQLQGKIFLPVIAPNKARILNEDLPDGVFKKSLTNYDAFKYCFDKLNIKYIDFEKYFEEIKNTSKYPIFSKYGIHWSTYGHCLATDSIINYFNTQYNLNTNSLIWKNDIELSDSLQNSDYDIGDGMNLFVDQLKSEKLAYPKLSFTKTTTQKPPLLVIGDSFNFGIEKTNVQNEIFSDYKLLYYFKELMPYTDDKDAFKKLNIKDEINNHKIILLLVTEHNFVDYGWGFLEKAINILDGKDNGTFDEKENKIMEMTKNIENNKVWLDKIKSDAALNHKDLTELIRENAIYMVNIKEKEGIAFKNKKVAEMIEYIKKDEKWMKNLNQKSKETKIGLDSLILEDAVYQVNLNNK